MMFKELAARIRALDDLAVDLSDPASPRPLAGRRCRVVGIDGLSGSGKSSFARRLAAELGAPVLSVDDLVPGWDALARAPGLLADGVLRPLAAGRPGRYRRYDWLAGRLADWVDLAPGDLLIAEGCCAGVPPAGGLLSYLIWLDAPPASDGGGSSSGRTGPPTLRSRSTGPAGRTRSRRPRIRLAGPTWWWTTAKTTPTRTGRTSSPSRPAVRAGLDDRTRPGRAAISQIRSVSC